MGRLRPGDIHALLAVAEVAERRKFSRFARFQVTEVAAMLAVGLHRAGAAIRRLMRLGAIHWTPKAAKLSCEPDTDAEPGFRGRSDSYGRARLVPLPRRMARFLIECAKPTLAWTAIGHAARTIYNHGKAARSIGTCSASWLASWAPLDERSIRRSRKVLSGCGWYSKVEAPHWAHRRGQLGRVSLDWDGRGLSPQSGRRRRGLSPPSIRPSLAEAINGDQHRRSRLAKIGKEELRDRASLAAMFEEAVGRGMIADGSESCRKFCAAAHHARSSGGRNPCGVFKWLIGGNLHRLNRQSLDASRSMQESIRPSPKPKAGQRTGASLRAVAHGGDRRLLRPRGLAKAHEGAVAALESGGDHCFQGAVDFLMGRGMPCVEARAVARLKFGQGSLIRYEQEVR